MKTYQFLAIFLMVLGIGGKIFLEEKVFALIALIYFSSGIILGIMGLLISVFRDIKRT